MTTRTEIRATARARAIAARAAEIVATAESDTDRYMLVAGRTEADLLDRHLFDLETLAVFWPEIIAAGDDPLEVLAWRASRGRWDDTAPPAPHGALAPETVALGRRMLAETFRRPGTATDGTES